MIIKNNFHKKGFALDLVLKQRLAVSLKWSITTSFSESHYVSHPHYGGWEEGRPRQRERTNHEADTPSADVAYMT